jgi:hypothetical protein
VVKLLQTLSKITSLYPVTLPAVFTKVLNKINILIDLDVNILPINCVASSANFHHKLLFMTLAPVLCIGYVGIFYIYQRFRIKGNVNEKKDMGILEADCIYFILVGGRRRPRPGGGVCLV